MSQSTYVVTITYSDDSRMISQADVRLAVVKAANERAVAFTDISVEAKGRRP